LPSPTFNNSIDWSRLAEPQADQYDTDVILHLASTTTSSDRPQLYQRTPVGESPAAFDGQVAVRHVYKPLPEFAPLSAQYPDGPTDHPNIHAAVDLIRNWPVAFVQCQRLLEAIHPAIDPQIPLESAEIYRGSLCHSFECLFGTMWATIFCPIALAEAIVHEMAHQKLRVLGVSFESATAVVGNDRSNLLVSPVIKDRLRPMTAVLHAQYSYVHVTALDVHLLAAESNSARREALREVLERNLARIKEGFDTIQKHFEPGEHGIEFMSGLRAWTERVIRSAEDLLGGGARPAARTQFPEAGLRAEHAPILRLPVDLLAAKAPAVFAYNGGIGDRLCNLPALRALASMFPKRLTLICSQGDRELYYSDLNLRAALELDLQQTDIGWTFDADSLARRIADCDLFLCINPWHTSSVSELLARFSGVESVGFFPDFRRPLPCDYYGHAMDMAFAVPASLNSTLQLADFSQPPAIAGTAMAMAQEFGRRHVRSSRTLFVHTDTKAEKSWPRERFARVLDNFLGEFPQFTALIVDVRGHGIERGRYPDRMLPLSLPLDACFAVLRDSDLFLGVDSCHLHAADLFRVPGVGLFGPTTCRRWGFKFSGCLQFQGRESTDTIEVDEVCRALYSLACLADDEAEQRTGGVHRRVAPLSAAESMKA
jgi:ADP-heptose:LPS heptosyltransferase